LSLLGLPKAWRGYRYLAQRTGESKGGKTPCEAHEAEGARPGILIGEEIPLETQSNSIPNDLFLQRLKMR